MTVQLPTKKEFNELTSFSPEIVAQQVVYTIPITMHLLYALYCKGIKIPGVEDEGLDYAALQQIIMLHTEDLGYVLAIIRMVMDVRSTGMSYVIGPLQRLDENIVRLKDIPDMHHVYIETLLKLLPNIGVKLPT
jgi:hypothetical protein